MQEKNTPLKKEIAAAGESDGQYSPISKSNPVPVVAIGLSAGGYEAMIRLLNYLSPSLGMAYVVIQQLSPGQGGILPALLANKTRMKVLKGREGMRLEKDHIYILPSGSYIGISEGILTPPSLFRKAEKYYPVDFFLMTLADAYRDNAISIVLSGDTTDGTAGTLAIRNAGGVTFAQDDTARFRAMPRHAVESGYIDFVLPPEKIASQLARLKNYNHFAPDPEQINRYKKELGKIYLQLVGRHQVDFSLCSQAAVIKCILRRMKLNLVNRLEDYGNLLVNNNFETDLLYRDLLSDMRRFFRSPAILKVLVKEVLPCLLKNKDPKEFIRIWVPFCNTGEDVYSLAICLWEYCRHKGIKNPVRIFATDPVLTTIEKARKGIYNQPALQHVSPSRLKRFFEKKDNAFRVNKEIHELCVFAVHDLLKDPPFSSIDIICCENVMIHLEPAIRERLLQSFHYALKPAGYFLPGSKEEMVTDPEALFLPVDDERKIYTRNEVPASRQLNFSFFNPVASASRRTGVESDHEATNILLSRYVPASILVDLDLQIIRFYGIISPYLRPAPGKASLKLFKMVRDELVFILHSLLDKLKNTGQRTIIERARLLGDETAREISLEVMPVKSNLGEILLLIIIRETLPAVWKGQSNPVGKKNEDEQKDHYIRKLEKDLLEARQQTLVVSSAFDKAREELQLIHEEMMSSNEELQSLNRQLEVSQDELRSANEELVKANKKL